MKKVKLYSGEVALVDDQDYDLVKDNKWYLRPSGYAYKSKHINGKNKKTYMHHVIMPDYERNKIHVDHINGNKLDNQRNNLRYISQQQNIHNSCMPKNNSTGYKGVAKKKDLDKPFRAYITLNSKQRHLGYFKTAEEAALAYNKAALELHGEFARLNTIERTDTRVYNLMFAA